MNRYLDSNDDLESVFQKVVAERFPMLSDVQFKLIFDNKKKVSKGNLVLASVELVNEKVRFLTTDNLIPEGYDYLLNVDSTAWEYATEEDKERLISHELNHVHIDEKGKLKLIGHDVEDFAREIQRNVDNPNWAENLATLTLAIYEQDEDNN